MCYTSLRRFSKFSALFNQTADMVKVRTLNELSQLVRSDFNQPPPRHGFRLLYWFAQEQHWLDPTSGAYGFHRFHNRIDDEEDHLLPYQNLPYYEVGNLNSAGAEKLPDYIRTRNSIHYNKQGNMDRIIVRLSDGRIDRVYVTEHEDQKEFSSSRTYRVSQGLLDQIRGMQREAFLNLMQQQREPQGTHQSQHTNYTYTQQNYTRNQGTDNQQNDNSWCTIL